MQRTMTYYRNKYKNIYQMMNGNMTSLCIREIFDYIIIQCILRYGGCNTHLSYSGWNMIFHLIIFITHCLIGQTTKIVSTNLTPVLSMYGNSLSQCVHFVVGPVMNLVHFTPSNLNIFIYVYKLHMEYSNHRSIIIYTYITYYYFNYFNIALLIIYM